MPSLMLDLDNTLLDRKAAFRGWASDLVRERDGGPAELSWLVTADRDGYEPRERLAAMIAQRFGGDLGTILEELRRGMVDRMVLDPATAGSLERARAAGWSLVVITNGTVTQQEHKLRHTGLDRLLDGWVTSESLGIGKPDPAIFAHALAITGDGPDGSWMVGDSAQHDVVGARSVGLGSIWLHRGREWPADLEPPDRVVATVPEAVDGVLERSDR